MFGNRIASVKVGVWHWRLIIEQINYMANRAFVNVIVIKAHKGQFVDICLYTIYLKKVFKDKKKLDTALLRQVIADALR